MKSSFKIMFAFAVIISLFSLPCFSLTPEEIIVKLRSMRAHVEVATTNAEAVASLKTFVIAQGLAEAPGLDNFEQRNYNSETSCTCCPSCTNPNFESPCVAECPEYACLLPGQYTRKCIAGSGNFEEKNVYLFAEFGPAGDYCCCAFLCTPFVEPCGYAFNLLSWVVGAIKAAGSYGVNGCALAFPCWTYESHPDEIEPTKAEMLAQIDGLIRKFSQLSKRHHEPPAYESPEK